MRFIFLCYLIGKSSLSISISLSEEETNVVMINLELHDIFFNSFYIYVSSPFCRSRTYEVIKVLIDGPRNKQWFLGAGFQSAREVKMVVCAYSHYKVKDSD